MENINIKFEFAILKTIAIILQKTNKKRSDLWLLEVGGGGRGIG